MYGGTPALVLAMNAQSQMIAPNKRQKNREKIHRFASITLVHGRLEQPKSERMIAIGHFSDRFIGRIRRHWALVDRNRIDVNVLAAARQNLSEKEARVQTLHDLRDIGLGAIRRQFGKREARMRTIETEHTLDENVRVA